MDAYEFEHKLQKLNPRLYLGRTPTDLFNGELGSTGIYLKGVRDAGSQQLANKVDTTVLGKAESVSAKHTRYLREADVYLGGVTLRHIPEGNVYLPDQSLWAKGWREIVLNLIAAGVVDLGKAREVFDRGDLGQSQWDLMSDLKKYNTHKFTRSQIYEYMASH